MRIQTRTKTGRYRLARYECDNCDAKTVDSVLPPDWLEDSKNTHYCADCIEELGD